MPPSGGAGRADGSGPVRERYRDRYSLCRGPLVFPNCRFSSTDPWRVNTRNGVIEADIRGRSRYFFPTRRSCDLRRGRRSVGRAVGAITGGELTERPISDPRAHTPLLARSSYCLRRPVIAVAPAGADKCMHGHSAPRTCAAPICGSVPRGSRGCIGAKGGALVTISTCRAPSSVSSRRRSLYAPRKT